jgi:hypothetical protein
VATACLTGSSLWLPNRVLNLIFTIKFFAGKGSSIQVHYLGEGRYARKLYLNIIPTIFKALHGKFVLVPMKTKLEEENEQLRAELEKEKLKIDAIHEFLRDKGLRL